MKKKYLLFLIALFAISLSCTDKSLDPLKFDEIKKGTILALRGTQLDRIYNKGLPGAEVFPKIATGAEVFAFDGEILAQDPSKLASVDVYAIQQTSGSTATTRQLMTNVPYSQFKNDGTYVHPWVSISLAFPDVLAKLGLANTFPLSDAVVNTLLSTYRNGINIECDLNLTDGSKILAADIVASGLFQSNQFYPAMRLNWAMTAYCPYVASTWGGAWIGDEIGSGVGGNDHNNFVAAGTDTWTMDNFFGDGPPVYATIKFNVSSDPSTATVAYVNDPGKTYQTTQDCGFGSSCLTGQISGSGTYNQCTGVFTLNTTYVIGGGTFKWIYNFHR
jgi:hypothetical protein